MANEPAFMHEIDVISPGSYTSDGGSHSMYLSSSSPSDATTFDQQLLTPKDFQGQEWLEDSELSEDERMLANGFGTQYTPQNLTWSRNRAVHNAPSAAFLPHGSSHIISTGRAEAGRIIDFRTYFEEAQSRTARVPGAADSASQVMDHGPATGSQRPQTHAADPYGSLPMSSLYQLPGSCETSAYSNSRLVNHAAGIGIVDPRWRNGQSSEPSAFDDAIMQNGQPPRDSHYIDEYTRMSLGQRFPLAKPGAGHYSGYPADHDVFYS